MQYVSAHLSPVPQGVFDTATGAPDSLLGCARTNAYSWMSPLVNEFTQDTAARAATLEQNLSQVPSAAVCLTKWDHQSRNPVVWVLAVPRFAWQAGLLLCSNDTCWRLLSQPGLGLFKR